MERLAAGQRFFKRTEGSRERRPLRELQATLISGGLMYVVFGFLYLAGNGHEVLHAMEKKSYDLVFMDVQMPEKDGIQATEDIRARYTEQPVIIALTAATQETDQDRCFKAGMNDYISKPMNFDKLEALIRRWGSRVNSE